MQACHLSVHLQQKPLYRYMKPRARGWRACGRLLVIMALVWMAMSDSRLSISGEEVIRHNCTIEEREDGLLCELNMEEIATHTLDHHFEAVWHHARSADPHSAPFFQEHSPQFTDIPNGKLTPLPLIKTPRSATSIIEDNSSFSLPADNTQPAHPPEPSIPPMGDHNAVLLLPGFASTQLYNWRFKDCFPFRYNLADRVWIDVAKILGAPACWVECMKLVPEDLSDPPNGCKLRPGEGMTSIGELDPGILTGPLSTVWQEFVSAMVEIFDYEPGRTIIAAPYDFRLAPMKLQERDYFFRHLMSKIEHTVEMQKSTKKLAHHGVIVIAHSMGNNIFRYFLEWLKDHEKENYQAWLDANIVAYVAAGAPLLGAPQAFEGIMSGVTFGLPRISSELAREMASTFGTPSWSIPFNPGDNYNNSWPIENMFTLTVNSDWAKTKEQREAEEIRRQEEAILAAAEAELALLAQKDPAAKGLEIPHKTNKAKKSEGKDLLSFPWTKTYSPSQVIDAFRDIAPFDPKVNNTVHFLDKYYLADPITKHFTPWERPPIKKVICAYGINMRTELGYHYATDLPKGTWRIEDIIYEDKGRIYNEKSGATYPATTTKSGDGTVPYASLSWCHHWLGGKDKVTVTKIPQRFYTRVDMNEDIIIPGEPLITFYESLNTTGRGDATAVWELDAVDHRDVIKNRVFLREFAEELLHEHSLLSRAALGEIGEGPSIPYFSSFAHKHARVPRGDYDCSWDYLAAKCKYPEYCEYRYVFGDLTLDQSCRLKPSVKQRIVPDLPRSKSSSSPGSAMAVEVAEAAAFALRVADVAKAAVTATDTISGDAP